MQKSLKKTIEELIIIIRYHEVAEEAKKQKIKPKPAEPAQKPAREEKVYVPPTRPKPEPVSPKKPELYTPPTKPAYEPVIPVEKAKPTRQEPTIIKPAEAKPSGLKKVIVGSIAACVLAGSVWFAADSYINSSSQRRADDYTRRFNSYRTAIDTDAKSAVDGMKDLREIVLKENHRFIVPVRNNVTEFYDNKVIPKEAELIAAEENKYLGYINQFASVQRDFNSLQYKSALGNLDSLLDQLGRERFDYEQELIKKFSGTHNFNGIAALIAGLRDYRENNIVKAIEGVNQTCQEVESRLRSYDSMIANGDANGLVKAYDETGALKANLAEPPYQENSALKSKAEDYNKRIYNKLSQLASQKRAYFSEKFKSIQNARDITKEAKEKETRDQMNALKQEYDLFNNSPLADARFSGGV